MEGDCRSVRLRIEGHVQGVGFRAWMADQAGVLGLDGWVRNAADGSVEAFASGPTETIGQLLEAVRRGPAGSAVRRVTFAEEAEGTTEKGFRIRR